MRIFCLIISSFVIFTLAVVHTANSEWIVYNSENSGLMYDCVNALYADSAGNVWIGTDGQGVSKFDGGSSWPFYNTLISGLIHDQITDITIDHDGNIWFATIVGISKFDGGSNWISYNSDNGLEHINIKALATDQSGNIWIGTFGAGVIKYDRDTTWIHYTTDSGLANNGILSILVDHTGSIWMGTYGGVSRFDAESTWTTFNKSNSDLLDDTVRCIAEDVFGNIWMGSNKGVNRLGVDSSWASYTYSDGLISTPVTAIAIDSSGNVWTGHDFIGQSGVWICEFDGVSEWTIYNIENNNEVNYVPVTDITVDLSGNVWFATRGEGLTCYKASSSAFPEYPNQTLPEGFTLFQNYPNPFNASTTIEYSLPVRMHVTISIFDILGQRIHTIVDATEAAGNYSIFWDGRDLDGGTVASGVYFYIIEAGSFVEAKKMILLK